ncbi:c-type cytochrome [Methylobacterium isbiliense]|jgi:cytochrome c oxidase cbb3-type subunit 3|uniref:Cytochrome c6 n=1 Tax=Methylobacterium isbiliense TaxID=315478 RepID=A0ABQ4SMT9_9HYPH|nr:c-type cytochrome [Methylobacterium isbiliense]MDN3627782.1 c-type cytochrome [Methylobacterium isbiliense]GJE04407.1 Cytochrome c6 [Methylobacterium isbiliense]
MTRRIFRLALAVLALSACQREDRTARPSPVGLESREEVALVVLSPGESQPTVRTSGKAKEFEGNAYHLSQGKKLFTWFNCSGCHAQGGGGMGPALIDDRWIYGGSIENIVQTIREGRPNGMPSFRGRIPDDQIWELAAYVRAMSGNAPSSAAPSRSDSMHPHPAENRTSPSPPVSGGIVPPSGQMPQ